MGREWQEEQQQGDNEFGLWTGSKLPLVRRLVSMSCGHSRNALRVDDPITFCSILQPRKEKTKGVGGVKWVLG